MIQPTSRASALTLGLLTAFAGGLTAQGDATADAALQKALARAGVHNKRVLVLFDDEDGGTYALWNKNAALGRVLRYEFETVQTSGERAHALAVQLKFPAALDARPAVTVLDSDGKVLDRLERHALFDDGRVHPAKLAVTLQPHFCKPVDAEQKLAEALADAKKTGRNVFIRFDAPW